MPTGCAGCAQAHPNHLSDHVSRTIPQFISVSLVLGNVIAGQCRVVEYNEDWLLGPPPDSRLVTSDVTCQDAESVRKSAYTQCCPALASEIT